MAGGAIYALDGGRLVVLSEGAGTDLWSWGPPALDLSSNIVVTNTHVFVSSAEGVYAIDRASHNQVWTNAEGGHLSLADGMLFVASSHGRLVGFQVAPPNSIVASAGADVVVECASEGGLGTAVQLDGSGSTGDGLTYAWSAPGVTFDDATSPTPVGRFPLGVTEVSLVVSAGGRTANDVLEVEVVDTTPPAISVSSDTPVLWPPNHQLVPVHFSVQADDGCDAQPTVSLLSVTAGDSPSGSPSETASRGAPRVTAGSTGFDVELRAERSGNGEGRTYKVCFEARDASGNTATGCAQVRVPHDQRGTGQLATNALGGVQVTLFGSAQLVARDLDPGSLHVVRAGCVPLRWNGMPVAIGDVNDDRKPDATISLVAEGIGPGGAGSSPLPGPAFAVWNAPDGMCLTPLAGSAVTGVGDGPESEVAFGAWLARNPGLGFAAIRYGLPAAGHVRLSVWDVSGRLVERLVDRDEVAGAHEARFAPEQRRGTQLYYYRIEWQGQTRTGRFILID